MYKLATDVPVLQIVGAYTALDCVGTPTYTAATDLTVSLLVEGR